MNDCHATGIGAGAITVMVRVPFHSGREGWTRSFMPASSGVLSALRALHGRQARTMFSQSVLPPFARGTTWSHVASAGLILSPQSLSALRPPVLLLRRLNLTARRGRRL